jgi:hypothetical protein
MAVIREARPHRLLLTGERHRGRHLVKLDARPIWLPGTLFIALCDLVRTRCTTATGFAVESSLNICRLRDLLDPAVKRHNGRSVIQTGDGQEYRLTLKPQRLSVHPTFAELPSPRFIDGELKRCLLTLQSRNAEIGLKSV